MADPKYTLSDQFPGDAEARVIEYSAAFSQALESAPKQVTPAYTQFQESNGSTLITRWYIPLNAAGYEKWQGTMPFRNLSETFFDLKIDKFADGVDEDADKVKAMDFGGFATQPQVMAKKAMAFPDNSLATLLNDGANQDSWDGQKFLVTTALHPFNLFNVGLGKYLNYRVSTALTEPNITLMLTNLMSRKGADGESMGYLGTDLLLSTALYETGRRLVEVPYAAGGANNPLYGRLKPVHWPGLKSTRFAIADANADAKPFAVSRINGGRPEMIEFGVGDEKYKLTQRVGFGAVLRIGTRLAMPGAIEVAQTDA